MTETEAGQARMFALAPQARTQELRDLADREGWQLIVDLPRGHRKFRHLAWRAPEDSEIHYVEDHQSGSRFVAAGRPGTDRADDLIALIGVAVPLEDQSAVLDRLEAATKPAEIIGALLTLGQFLARQQRVPQDFGARLAQIVARLAGHPVRQVRQATIMTMADLVQPFPEVAAPVLARRQQEKDLAKLLDAFARVASRAGQA